MAGDMKRVFGPVEGLEDMVQLVGRDPESFVDELDHQPAISRLQLDPDPVILAEFAAIFHQVFETIA